jgi:hypothetical protein
MARRARALDHCAFLSPQIEAVVVRRAVAGFCDLWRQLADWMDRDVGRLLRLGELPQAEGYSRRARHG